MRKAFALGSTAHLRPASYALSPPRAAPELRAATPPADRRPSATRDGTIPPAAAAAVPEGASQAQTPAAASAPAAAAAAPAGPRTICIKLMRDAVEIVLGAVQVDGALRHGRLLRSGV